MSKVQEIEARFREGMIADKAAQQAAHDEREKNRPEVTRFTGPALNGWSPSVPVALRLLNAITRSLRLACSRRLKPSLPVWRDWSGKES